MRPDEQEGGGVVDRPGTIVPSASQRAVRGAIEGVATGFVVALVRAGMTVSRQGLPDNFGEALPGIAGFFLVKIVTCAYIFAVGRAIAGGIAGSLLGAGTLAVGGAYVGSTTSAGPVIPVAAGAAIGALIGSPAGAFIHKSASRSR